MTREKQRAFLAGQLRTDLRRILWALRREEARPHEVNYAAAQLDGIATASQVRAEYRRRGWKVPKPTRAERKERFS